MIQTTTTKEKWLTDNGNAAELALARRVGAFPRISEN